MIFEQTHSLRTIATIQSCYSQRFGIPRQAGLVKSALATVNFEATKDNEYSLRGIESFTHLWIIFVFHRQHYTRFKPLVQPPRLGGKKTMGVFATRSPNRPNPVGLSAVKLERIEFGADEHKVVVRGGDFLDGTPVLDIKPYVPFVDALTDATSAWATPIDDMLSVAWDEAAETQLAAVEQQIGTVQSGASGLKILVEETLVQDPRPAYERAKDGKPGQQWGIQVGPVNVRFRVEDGVAFVGSVNADVDR
ncbi:MAG: tRNA (N6-threonylcarbamoyladenosine(37)-N6)-methyltransferase TrmO [Granulosicoccus sp.]